MTPAASPRGRGGAQLLGYLALALLVLVPSWNSLGNPGVRDTAVLVTENLGIRHLAPFSRHFLDTSSYSTAPLFNRMSYRPLMPLTYSLNYAIHGLAPAGYRITNLALLWLGACLLVPLARRLLEEVPSIAPEDRGWIAWLAAALLAAHPVSHFTAQYIGNRNLVLMQPLLLAALLLYLDLDRSPWRRARWAAALSCFALALLCRENALMLPFTMVLVEWRLRGRGLLEPATWRKPLAFLGVVVGYLAFRSHVLGQTPVGDSATSLGVDLASHLRAVFYQLHVQVSQYLANFLWPPPIRWEPAVPEAWPPGAAAMLGVLTFVGLVGAALGASARRSLVAFGFLAYLLPMAPAALVQPFWAVHYRPFLGSPFLMLAAAALLVPAAASRARRALVGMLVLALAGAATRIAPIASGPAMWTHSVAHGGAPIARLQLLMRIRDPVLREEGIGALVGAAPREMRVRLERARARLSLGNAAGAAEDLEAVLAAEPLRGEAWFWLAAARDGLEDGAGAAAALERAGQLDSAPRRPQVRLILAEALQHRGGVRVALSLARWLTETGGPEELPGDEFLLGVCLHALGDGIGAARALRRAWDGGHRHAVLGRLLAEPRVRSGDCAAAAPFLAATDPADPQAAALRAACSGGAP